MIRRERCRVASVKPFEAQELASESFSPGVARSQLVTLATLFLINPESESAYLNFTGNNQNYQDALFSSTPAKIFNLSVTGCSYPYFQFNNFSNKIKQF